MKQKGAADTGLVYSTEHGRTCPGCGRPKDGCECGPKRLKCQNDGTVRISRASRGRQGKGMMLISGVPLDSAELNKLGKELKVKFGVGGAVKNGTIELQGDFREKLAEELRRHGWIVKLSGG